MMPVIHYIKQRWQELSQALRHNPTVAAITLEGFLTRFGYGMISLAMPLFALHLGMSVAEIGLLYAVRSVTTLLVKPLMGAAADRFGRKRILLIAVVLRALIGLLFIFATTAWHLFAIRILHGIMTAARDPSAMALIAEHGTPNNMASSYAWYLTARDAGRSLGFMAAGLLIAPLGYPGVFLIAFITSAMAVVTVIRYVRESRELDKPPVLTQPISPDQTAVKEKNSPRYRKYLPYATFGFTIAISAGMMRGIFPVIAVQYALLSPAQIGVIVGASTIALLIAAPLFAWLSDHVNRKLALSMRSVANVLSSLLYIFAPNFSGFFYGRMLDEAGNAAFRPSWGALLAELSGEYPPYRARVMATVDTASSLGDTLGPALAGGMIALLGIPAMLTLRIIIAIAAELQAILFFKFPPSKSREKD